MEQKTSNDLQFQSTGDRIIDTMIAFALSDIILRADRQAKIEWNIGKREFLKVQSSDRNVMEKALDKLKEQVKTFTIAEAFPSYNFNVGNKLWSVSFRACDFCPSDNCSIKLERIIKILNEESKQSIDDIYKLVSQKLEPLMNADKNIKRKRDKKKIRNEKSKTKDDKTRFREAFQIYKEKGDASLLKEVSKSISINARETMRKLRPLGILSKVYCGKTNIHPYPILAKTVENLNKISESEFQFIEKKRELRDFQTLYIALSPYWSKGVRQWDSVRSTNTTPTTRVIFALSLYGLARYTISRRIGKNVLNILFVPYIGVNLSHQEVARILKLVRRILNIFKTEISSISLADLPINTLPLAIITQLDLPAILELYQTPLSLIFINYDTAKGTPKNPRGYEEYNIAETAEFCKELEEHYWDFRSMVKSLIRNLPRDEYKTYKTELLRILTDISRAISTGNMDLFNEALFHIIRIDKMKTIPRETVFKIQMSLKSG